MRSISSAGLCGGCSQWPLPAALSCYSELDGRRRGFAELPVLGAGGGVVTALSNVGGRCKLVNVRSKGGELTRCTFPKIVRKIRSLPEGKWEGGAPECQEPL